MNWIRGADRTSSGFIRDGSEDIAIGYEENMLVVRMGNILPNPQDPEAEFSNFGFEAMQTVGTNPPDDGQWHLIIGKLELNVNGGVNERLTAWIDPTGVESGGTSVQLERDMLTDLSELLGTFDAQATNYVPEDELDPERGRTYIDDIAIGTAWQDVVNVEIPRLTLRINPDTGVGRLVNLTGSDFALDAYSIESAAGSLSATGWNSLDDQNQDNWLENEATSNQLVETDFLGSTTIAAGGQLALGNLFNTSGITTQDVVGRYSTQDGLINLLNVEYSTGGLAGDFDNDGDVDGRDFLTWQRNPSVGNLVDWKANYGMSGAVAAAASVPEPASAAFLVWGLLVWGHTTRSTDRA